MVNAIATIIKEPRKGNFNMRKLLIVAATLISSVAVAQQGTPQLNTADRVAIASLEKQKGAAKDSFGEAQKAEQQILQEFAQAHPGFVVNPDSFQVVALPKQEAKPQPTPKK